MTVPEVLPHVRAIYEKHAAGCCMHIVTDDCNTDDHSVQWCIEKAREMGHNDCLRVLEMLATMSRTQRRQVWLKR